MLWFINFWKVDIGFILNHNAPLLVHPNTINVDE